MNKFSRVVDGLFLVAVLSVTSLAQAQQISQAEQLIEQLSAIQLDMSDKAKAEAALKALLEEAVSYRDANPALAEAWIATARVRTNYARMLGASPSAFSLAKEVKAEFEKAIALNPSTQEGLAQGYLGQVYLQVPGWPLSFGDTKKGVQLLQDTLVSNPNNALANFFYAQYLVGKKQYRDAQTYLQKASAAIATDNAHPKSQQIQQRNIANLEKIIAGKL
jgi:Tfp pilus assembly protein PilF